MKKDKKSHYKIEKRPFILNFDSDSHAVIEPGHEELPFKLHPKLLYAFIFKEEIDAFLDKHLHKTIGRFESFVFEPKIYEVELNGELFTLCQAPLGAPAAVQLLDFLISYGVKEVIAIGSCGALIDLPENEILLPSRAIRDEGTSFHYMEPGQFVEINSKFLNKIKASLKGINLKFLEVTTWITDGFFRETRNKVTQFKKIGASVVEMECAAMAACAQFRKVDFAQILFTADSLANLDNHDERNWGRESHSVSLEIGATVLTNLNKE